MNQSESPHQAAIAKPSVPEITGPFKAKVRPVLHPAAAHLVRIYEATPGAITYPGCMPEALAAVIDKISDQFRRVHSDPDADTAAVLAATAAMLRGEQP
jgi:hypothetical protein